MNVVAGFAGALLFGVLLAAFFTNGLGHISSYMFRGLLLLALFLPIYRAEYVLGFVLGMTFTFGAVLPTAVASLVALISAVLFNYVRTVFLRIGFWFMHKWVPPAVQGGSSTAENTDAGRGSGEQVVSR